MKTIWTIGRCVRPLAAMGLHEKIVISSNSPRVRFKETSASTSNELPIEVNSIVDFNDFDFYEIMKEHDSKILAELRAINDASSKKDNPIQVDSIFNDSDFYKIMEELDLKLDELRAINDASSKKDNQRSIDIDEWNVVKASWENNSVFLEFKSDEEAKEFFETYKKAKSLKEKK